MASEPPIVAALEPAKERPQEAVERTTSSSSSIKQHESLPSQRTHNPPGPTQQPTIAAVGTGKYANGYHFPPKYPIKEQMRMGVVAFWSFYNTGFGFFFTVYALNVVGWVFMLLLLLVGAAPEMCWVNGRRDCDNIESPRRLWIEIDSQILTALFSATGFGLAPWRIRDLYLLLRYRINKDRKALRRLAGVHRHWLRLEGSDELQPTLGPKNIEETTLWRMDFIAWLNIWYIVFQAFLSGFMWALSRYNRPPWTTGLFFALTFITSSARVIMEVSQAMKVRAIEGVPLTKSDIRRLVRDKELGIPHYNNIKDKDPAEEERKKAEKKAKRTNRFSRRSEKPASDGTI
ncbi:putative alpha-l-rhamnosidase c protein [Rosellinia necatrix]|uniref:Putative alpha-l-rhamnosidase c protein n=1 Tax=Rosellinia necatrix TaxID=77044 RepID=A0A1S8A7H4_ROSNE|nr:putative alpha-l-rhamnosidase c protein [Rosellinia necatrix]